MIPLSSLLLASIFAISTIAELASASATASTPFGERPVTSLHKVPAGGEVRLLDEEIHIIDSNGNIVHTTQTQDAVPCIDTTGATTSAYSYWSNSGNSPLSSFTAEWVIPPLPDTNDGQTLYLDHRLDDASGEYILASIIQYGASAAGGGDFWAVASWYCANGEWFYTSPVEVAPGEVVTGAITLTSSSGVNFNCLAEFQDVSGSSFTVTNVPEFVWAYLDLVVWGYVSISDFPAGTPGLNVAEVELTTTTGAPSVVWTVIENNGHAVEVNGASANITLNW